MKTALVPLAPGLTVLGLLLSACSPALNWRQVLVPDADVALQFPCKPERQVQPGLGLLQCEADGMRFVLGWREWAEPGEAQLALARAAGEAGARMAATPVFDAKASVPAAALSWAGTGRYRLESAAGRVELQVWARGLTIYQAYVMSSGRLQGDAARLFLDGIRSAA